MWWIGVVAVVACTSSGDGDSASDDTTPRPGLGVLGYLTHDIGQVNVFVVGTDDDGLDIVRDLEIDPGVPGRLWTVNRADDSVVIFDGADTDAPTSQKIIDPYALHFMDNVSSIAFGAPGMFATCQESRNTYNDTAPPNDFMGPTLWSSDLDIFGQSNPAAVKYLTDKYGVYTDLGSHLDMLHDTPLCMGIAWEVDNAYWTFDGWDSISRQDFQQDHGPGFDDHSDGEILRYVEGEVDRLPDVPSHLEFDHDTKLLYISDTGNGRIAVLDTQTGTIGAELPQTDATQYPVHNRMDDAVITTFVSKGLDEPSGMALHDGYVWVSDHATGLIAAYDMKGAIVDWVNVEPGIMGIAFGPDGSLYYANGETNEVIRMRPLDE